MRLFRALSLLLVLALLLGACAGQNAEEEGDLPLPADVPPVAPTDVAASTDATAPSGEPAVIGFGAQEYRRALYQPLIDQFNQENPNIQVQFVSLDDIAREGDSYTFDNNKIMRAVDVAEIFGVGEADTERGLVLDLTLFIEADPSFNREDFFPHALRETNGRIYGVPLGLHLPLLRYNRDVWDAAGLPSPTPDWNWADFTGALSQIASKRGDEIETYGFVGWNSGLVMLLGDLAANNIDIARSDTATLDDPAVIETLERINELAEQGVFFAPSNEPGSSDYETMRKLVVEGHAGMWDAQMFFDSDQNASDRTGTAALPRGSAAQGIYESETLAISAGSQAPQAAWQWLSFVSRQQTTDEPGFDRGPSFIPARQSTAESTGYWKELDEEAATAVRSLVEQPGANASAFAYQHYGPLLTALESVRKGTDPATAARDAESQREKLLAEAQTLPEAQTTAVPFVVLPPERAVAAEGATTITFALPYDVGQFEPFAKQFNEQHPDVFVELRAAPPTTETLTITDLAQSSDCFFYWSLPGPEEYPFLLDLQPLADADATFPRDDFPGATLSLYRQGSALYGLPQEILFPVLGYNAIAFERAGIAPPTIDWTMEDLTDAATRLTSGEGEEKQYGYASEGSDLITFFEQQGASLISGSGDTAQPNFTDTKVAAGVQAYVDLLRASSPNTKLSGYSRGEFNDDVFTLRQQGRVGMWYQYSVDMGSFGFEENKEAYQPAVAPLPNSALLSSGSISGNGLHISSQTEHQQACWQWLTFLSGQAGATTYGIPARLSVAQSPAFLDASPQGTAEVVQAYQAVAENTTATVPWWQTDIDFYWFYRAIDRVLQGEDLDRELDEAQQLTSDFLACVRTGDTGPACAKQVDPEYNGWENFEER